MPELDTLRGTAILLVLFLHGFAHLFNPSAFSGMAHIFVAVTSYGWIGVQLFFVLSGFLITGILLDEKSHPKYFRRFFARRGLRILPAYYLLLIVLLLIGRRAGFENHHVGVPFILLSFVYLSNATPLLGIPIQYTVLWSLAVEEHFYIIWPAIVRNLSRRSILVVASGIVMLAPMIRAASAVYGNLNHANFYTWCNADGLALGAIVAVLVRANVTRGVLLRSAITLMGVSGGVIVASALLNQLRWETPVGFALRLTFLNFFFTALLVLALIIGTTRWRPLVNIRPLQFLGNISYGLYLYHMVFFFEYENLVKRFWPSMAPHDGEFGKVALQFFCVSCISIVVASISKKYFESYFLQFKNRVAPPSQKQTEDSRGSSACMKNDQFTLAS